MKSLFHPIFFMTSLAISIACASSFAIYSASPETAKCKSAPPISSSVAISPSEALNKGGPAKNIFDLSLTTII